MAGWGQWQGGHSMEERSHPQKKREPANEEGETVAGLPRYHTHTTMIIRVPRVFTALSCQEWFWWCITPAAGGC